MIRPRGLTYRRALTLVLLAAATIAVVALRVLPYSEPLPIYLESAKELLATNHISDHHAPGYAIALAGAIAIGGSGAIGWLHGFLYLALVALSFGLLRAVRLSPVWCVVGAMAVALHPMMVMTLTRISDNNLGSLLLLLFVAILVGITKRGVTSVRLVTAGVVGGALALVRVNALSLFFVLMLVVLHSRRRLLPAIGLTSAALSLALVTTLIVQHRVRGVWQLSDPYYGAYTLHNGTNPYSARQFLEQTTAEYSTLEAMKDEGYPDLRVLTKEQQTAIFLRLSWQFVRDHPREYIQLIGIKLFNLLRPDYRRLARGSMASTFLVASLQTLLALVIPLWLLLRVRATGMRWHDGLLAVVVVPLYVLPFVLTYAEPRYRWPLDALVLLETVYLWRRAHGMNSATARQR